MFVTSISVIVKIFLNLNIKYHIMCWNVKFNSIQCCFIQLYTVHIQCKHGLKQRL